MKLHFAYIGSLVLISLVHGNPSCTGTTSIKTNAELESIKDCVEYDGSIAIGSSFSGEVVLPKLKTVTGDLKLVSKKITIISLDFLDNVGKKLMLHKLDNIVAINLPALQTVPELYFDDLKNELDIVFQAGLKAVKSITIKDTQIKTLKNIQVEKIENLRVTGNSKLNKLDLPSLITVEKDIVFSGSETASFNAPKLQTVGGELTLTNIDSASIPALERLNSLQFTHTKETKFTVPKLTNVYGKIEIENNDLLKGIDFTSLTTVGSLGIEIHKNKALHTINFSSLKKITTFVVTDSSVTKILLSDDLIFDHYLNVETNTNCSQLNKIIVNNSHKGTCKSLSGSPAESNKPSSSSIKLSLSSMGIIAGLSAYIL